MFDGRDPTHNVIEGVYFSLVTFFYPALIHPPNTPQDDIVASQNDNTSVFLEWTEAELQGVTDEDTTYFLINIMQSGVAASISPQ
jgi:hypothetical protein